MKASQQKFIQSLDKRLFDIENQIKQRKLEQEKVNAIFIEHVKRELEMLENQENNVKQRNSAFLAEVNNFKSSFNRFAPQVMEIDEKIRQAQQRFHFQFINHQADLSNYQPERKGRF